MSINSTIIKSLEPIGWPVVSSERRTEENRYIVFNYTSLPDNFGDDAPQHERYLIQIHMFCPSVTNTVVLRKQVKRLLFESGFTFPTMTDASDDEGQHWVFECEMAVGPYG